MIFKEVDAGLPLKMEASEAKRLRSLEAENSKLKRLVADQALDIVGLKDILSKKW